VIWGCEGAFLLEIFSDLDGGGLAGEACFEGLAWRWRCIHIANEFDPLTILPYLTFLPPPLRPLFFELPPFFILEESAR
jgi:hypothetical protein